MLALYRSGRQADALRAYQDARDVLVEELGIEPGPGLRALEERILAQDPDLGWQARAGYRNSGAEAEETLSATFVGRTHERLRLLGRLGEVQGGSGPPGVAVRRTGHRQDAAVRGAERARAQSADAGRVGTRLGRRRRARVLAVGAGAAQARRGHARRRARHRDRRQRCRHRASRPRLRPFRHGRRRRARRGVGPVPLLRGGRDAPAQPLDPPGPRRGARRPALGRPELAPSARVRGERVAELVGVPRRHVP